MQEKQVAVDFFVQLEMTVGSQYMLHIVKYVVERGNLTNPDAFIKRLTDDLPGEREDIMAIAEQLINRGVQQGMQQGVLEGKLEVACSLMARGYALSAIAEITGLSIDVLQMHLMGSAKN